MADTTFPPIQTQPKVERKINPGEIIGGAFENFFETVTGTGIGYTATNESTPSYSRVEGSPFASKGEITGFQTPNSAETTDRQLFLDQRAAVAEAEGILRQSRTEFIAEEEVRLEITGMPEEARNETLHLSTSFRRKNTETAYHQAELYRKRKIALRAAQQQSQQVPIPSPAKQPSALARMFEGGSGTQGSGTANLSAHATG